MAPSNVTMPLYVNRTLNVKIYAMCEKITLNVILNVLKSTYFVTLTCTDGGVKVKMKYTFANLHCSLGRLVSALNKWVE